MGITDPNIYCSITQSWLNVIVPQQYFFPHHHSNSIISGVFYPKCLKYPDDRLDEIIYFNLYSSIAFKLIFLIIRFISLFIISIW